MDFKDWIISEVGIADNQQMTLDFVTGGYEVRFSHNGVPFKVAFEQVPITFQQQRVFPAYDVVFTGPSGTSTTNKSGASATAIYSKVMAAIQKLMDTVEVNGLAFSPAEPAMGLIYQRLFERLGKEFVRVASSYYVRRTYLQELLSKMGDNGKAGVYSKILATARNSRAEEKRVRDDKVKARNSRQGLQGGVGKIFVLSDGRPIYVLALSSGRVSGVYQTPSGRARTNDFGYHEVEPKLASTEQVRNLLIAIRHGLDNNMFFDPGEIDTPQMQALMNKYGIKSGVEAPKGGATPSSWDARGWDHI